MPPTWAPLQAQTFQYLEACDVSTMSGGLQQIRSQAQSIEVIDHPNSVMASWTGFQRQEYLFYFSSFYLGEVDSHCHILRMNRGKGTTWDGIIADLGGCITNPGESNSVIVAVTLSPHTHHRLAL